MTKPVDLSELFAQTDVEMERLGWTPQQGKEFLLETYGKQGRTLLAEEELLDFLRYLKYLPTPETKLDNSTPINIDRLNKDNKTIKTTIKTTTSRAKKNNLSEPIDLCDVIAKTDAEMERIGWTSQQGREYLIQTYGKRGRTLLTEEELLDFLQHLESIPTPEFLQEVPSEWF